MAECDGYTWQSNDDCNLANKKYWRDLAEVALKAVDPER